MMKVLALCALLPAVFASPLTVHAPVAGGKSSIPYLFDHYYQSFLNSSPSGKYTGSKTVLGQEIQVNTAFSADGSLSFDVTGAISVSCDSESYSYADGTITVANLDTAGDCLHDALAANQATLLSFSYNTASDEVEVDLKYAILTIKIVLKHTARFPATLRPNPLALSTALEKYAGVFALSDPAGTYYGDKSILGADIQATIKIKSGTEFDIVLGGAISIECDAEAYTYSNGVISVTNVDKDGDCMHDDLKDNNVKLESISYDAASDVISVKVKYTIISITLELKHQSVRDLRRLAPHAHTKPESEPRVHLYDLVDRYYNVFATQTPTGKYEGVKSVLGQKVDTVVSIDDANNLSFSVSGVISLSCTKEAYTYANGVISLANIGKSGDCVHDALSSNHCSLESMEYDTSSDEILVKIKYAVITISLELKHQSVADLRHARALVPASPASLDQLYRNFLLSNLSQSPSGTYTGTKSVLGITVTATTVARASDFDINISGPITISCPKEAYTYANGVVTVTNIGQSGDCMHDALQSEKVTLKSIDYDEAADHITIQVKYTFLTINIELDKTA